MDDARIAQLAEEVLSQLRSGPSEPSADLESRVAALEAALRELRGGTAAPAATTTLVVAQSSAPAPGHPAFGLLGPSADGQGRCVLEPEKPCVASGQCRSFGH